MAVLLTASAVAAQPAWAARLGHSRVVSAQNAPLQVLIPLTDLTPDERASLQVTVASADAWARAGLKPPVPLDSMTLKVEAGADPSQRNVRLTSPNVASDPAVDVLLNIGSGTGQRLVQLTVMQSAQGFPGLNSQATVGSATRAGGGGSVAVRQGDTLYGIAQSHALADATIYQMLVALWRANPQAFIQNNMNRVKAGARLIVPDASTVRAIDPGEARRIFLEQAQAYARYRAGLAGAAGRGAPATQAPATSGQVGSGAPATQPEAGAEDRLRLSSGVPGQPGQGGEAAAQARADAETSTAKATQDAKSRVDELERNVKDLNAALARQQGQGGQGAAGPGLTVPGLALAGGPGVAVQGGSSGQSGASGQSATGQAGANAQAGVGGAGVNGQAGAGAGGQAGAGTQPGAAGSPAAGQAGGSGQPVAGDSAGAAVGQSGATGAGQAGAAGQSGSGAPQGADGANTGAAGGTNPSAGNAATAGGDGTSGAAGSSGAGGATGANGTAGANGAAGANGTSGVNGTAGANGAAGSGAAGASSSGAASTAGAGAGSVNGAGAASSGVNAPVGAGSPSASDSANARAGADRAAATNGGDSLSAGGKAARPTSALPRWLSDNLLIFLTVVLTLIAFVIAWLLRRAGARREDEDDDMDEDLYATEIDPAAIDRRLDGIDLDLDSKPGDTPARREPGVTRPGTLRS
ncbi:peptidoglycan-binding protein LysM [Achromobacter aloeverae]|uniref:Peptidoglycan-binding protein LysM n=2 Tax=Achromobacter aloeverae TaxID=1750518 RepID=A0A4Q1HPA5_9BURK|nr:peptidoglycan-binding protein LysM [Achromobacter aloeverae]